MKKQHGMHRSYVRQGCDSCSIRACLLLDGSLRWSCVLDLAVTEKKSFPLVSKRQSQRFGYRVCTSCVLEWVMNDSDGLTNSEEEGCWYWFMVAHWYYNIQLEQSCGLWIRSLVPVWYPSKIDFSLTKRLKKWGRQVTSIGDFLNCSLAYAWCSRPAVTRSPPGIVLNILPYVFI